MNLRDYNSRIKIITSKIIEILTKFWVAVPILFGMLFPMIYMFPLAFTSWWLFGFGHTYWLNCFLNLDYHLPVVYIPLFLIEGIIFLIGISLFFAGLITLNANFFSLSFKSQEYFINIISIIFTSHFKLRTSHLALRLSFYCQLQHAIGKLPPQFVNQPIPPPSSSNAQ